VRYPAAPTDRLRHRDTRPLAVGPADRDKRKRQGRRPQLRPNGGHPLEPQRDGLGMQAASASQPGIKVVEAFHVGCLDVDSHNHADRHTAPLGTRRTAPLTHIAHPESRPLQGPWTHATAHRNANRPYAQDAIQTGTTVRTYRGRCVRIASRSAMRSRRSRRSMIMSSAPLSIRNSLR
jgi:hypothetical protein